MAGSDSERLLALLGNSGGGSLLVRPAGILGSAAAEKV